MRAIAIALAKIGCSLKHRSSDISFNTAQTRNENLVICQVSHLGAWPRPLWSRRERRSKQTSLPESSNKRYWNNKEVVAHEEGTLLLLWCKEDAFLLLRRCSRLAGGLVALPITALAIHRAIPHKLTTATLKESGLHASRRCTSVARCSGRPGTFSIPSPSAACRHWMHWV